MKIYGKDILFMLLPGGGWAISGDEYEGIQFLECEPITKAQFEAGFAQYPAWKAEQDAQAQAAIEQAATDKASATAKLEALGLTADDLKALGL